MSITKDEAIKALQEREYLFVLYSQATRLPYVVEAEDTANDQVWIFASEEEMKTVGQKKLEDKILVMGMRHVKKDFVKLYGTLHMIGVNSILWHDGDEQIEVDLSDIARQVDLSKIDA